VQFDVDEDRELLLGCVMLLEDEVADAGCDMRLELKREIVGAARG
jgi:hypothetical protein